MTRHDRLIIGMSVLVALLSLLGRMLWARLNGNPVLVVKGQQGEVYRAALHEQPRTITVTGPVGKSVVEVSDTGVRMLESDCPDKICVHMGWIKRAGQVIVCMPNRVIITLEESGR